MLTSENAGNRPPECGEWAAQPNGKGPALPRSEQWVETSQSELRVLPEVEACECEPRDTRRNNDALDANQNDVGPAADRSRLVFRRGGQPHTERVVAQLGCREFGDPVGVCRGAIRACVPG